MMRMANDGGGGCVDGAHARKVVGSDWIVGMWSTFGHWRNTHRKVFRWPEVAASGLGGADGCRKYYERRGEHMSRLGHLTDGPSSSNPIPNSIPEGSSGNHGGQSSSDRSQSGTEDDLTLQSVYDLFVYLCTQVITQAAQIKDLKTRIKQLNKKARPVINHHKAWIKSLSMKKRLARKKKMESVSKQGRKTFKSEPTLHKDPAFDDLDDAMDYMETEDAHDEGTMKKQE
ncbi:hypothetical protein Tco_0110264 [Tanacetum coccineum]